MSNDKREELKEMLIDILNNECQLVLSVEGTGIQVQLFINDTKALETTLENVTVNISDVYGLEDKFSKF